ncbi:MAG: hypothetical protein H6834_06990 [Planctomycetes bacterium]|nr:hypothetical protein [Planctomycetota bacterium]
MRFACNAWFVALWLGVPLAAQDSPVTDPLVDAHERLVRALASGSAEAFTALRPPSTAAGEGPGDVIELWRGRLGAWKAALEDPWVRVQQDVLSHPPHVAGLTDARRVFWGVELDVPTDAGTNVPLLAAASWTIEDGRWLLQDLHLRYLEADEVAGTPGAPLALRSRSFEEIVRWRGASVRSGIDLRPLPRDPAIEDCVFAPGVAVRHCLVALAAADSNTLERWSRLVLPPEVANVEFQRRRLQAVVARFDPAMAFLDTWPAISRIDPRVRRLRLSVVTAKGRQEVVLDGRETAPGGPSTLRLVSARWEAEGRPTLWFPGPLTVFLKRGD